MSMHRIPLTDLERSGLQAHGLDIGKPSQLSDVFRQGVKWAIENGMLEQPNGEVAFGTYTETVHTQTGMVVKDGFILGPQDYTISLKGFHVKHTHVFTSPPSPPRDLPRDWKATIENAIGFIDASAECCMDPDISRPFHTCVTKLKRLRTALLSQGKSQSNTKTNNKEPS